MTLSIMTLPITPPRIMPLRLTTLRMMVLRIMVLSIRTYSMKTLLTTFSIVLILHRHLSFLLTLMLSVIITSVVMLSVVAPFRVVQVLANLTTTIGIEASTQNKGRLGLFKNSI